ncbi:hypothetical protein G7Z17_g5796 [Cylindrodendrum hubeiense]|uniref:Hedgehog/Intein (Hint) domain-containing protein n=1 Tax=Cylindrodendrum hubeiense TaxID=595255 RepID=A0A9P5H8C1_9HYPO|nr:hypothetical protein G7Z17_g5796 [Cylindrodendrum hubeiense]
MADPSTAIADLSAATAQEPLNNTVETGPESPPTLFASCFVPGTLVETMRGSMAIESLAEDDMILTRAGATRQWGVRSDEVVENPAPGILYGFNNGPAFFTAGHPFHTTTGLRAIDPHLARQENPWLNVGELRVGHQLLRLNDDKTDYELETITSISRAQSNATSVYGVHLREGLRSYHANGYLVALNYPEITAAAIARQLQTISAQERVKIIQSLNEIKPLFQRFGAGTVIDRLTREANSSAPLAYGDRPEDS